MKRYIVSTTRLSFALLALCLGSAVAAAPPATRPLDSRVIDLPRPDVSLLTRRCAHPFEDRGTYQIPAGYSGAGTSAKAIPVGKFLQVRTATVTLAESDWRGTHLGVWTNGDFAWYPLRMHNGAAVFGVGEDGPLYADGGGQTFKFVSYRARGYDRPANGTYVVRGCLLDSIPTWVTKPDMRVPRYPKKVLTPLEPVELWDGVRRPMQRPLR
ncbi:MAG: hypothetical protein ABWX88_09100 [Pseudoxanthomonas sp.]